MILWVFQHRSMYPVSNIFQIIDTHVLDIRNQ